MPSECWVAVSGYRALYAVSNHGRVMSFIARRSSKVGDFILSPASCKTSQYPKVLLYGKGGRKSCRVADIVTSSFLGPKPKGWNVNHKDGVKSNSNLSNLEYVTPSENFHHALRLGLIKPARFQKRTHCKRGHEFTESNSYWTGGRRRCGICHNARQRKYRAALNA